MYYLLIIFSVPSLIIYVFIATEGWDYVPLNQTLLDFQYIEPGEGVRDCTEVVIVDDTELEPRESVAITYDIGNNSNARVNHLVSIVDNDGELT